MRPPRLRCTLFPIIYPPHLLVLPATFWTSSLLADLSVFPSLICDFCPSDRRFAYSFLQIPPHDRHPCCSAIYFPLSGRIRDLHPLERAHGARTRKRIGRCYLFAFSISKFISIQFLPWHSTFLQMILALYFWHICFT